VLPQDPRTLDGGMAEERPRPRPICITRYVDSLPGESIPAGHPVRVSSMTVRPSWLDPISTRTFWLSRQPCIRSSCCICRMTVGFRVPIGVCARGFELYFWSMAESFREWESAVSAQATTSSSMESVPDCSPAISCRIANRPQIDVCRVGADENIRFPCPQP